MFKYIEAVVWKELKVFKNAWISKAIGILALSAFLDIILIFRAKAFSSLDPGQLALYTLIVISYITFIQNLRFWQEKGYRTLEAVLSTNISIREFVIGKVIAPSIISICAVVLNYIILNIGLNLYAGGILLNLKVLIIPICLAIVFNWCYGIINGYCMWCASISKAKVMQYITVGMYLFCIGNSFIYTSNTVSLEVMKYILLVLVILSFVFLFKMNKEKAILNLLD